MKKLTLLLFASVIFLSCEHQETPSKAMQANLNDNFFRAYSVVAFVDNEDQMVRIYGGTGNETFNLYTQWQGTGVYKIGENEVNYATFEGTDDKLYTTKSEGSSGTITITNDDKENQKFTGEFNFTFVTATDTIAVSGGIFYAVPYKILDVVID